MHVLVDAKHCRVLRQSEKMAKFSVLIYSYIHNIIYGNTFCNKYENIAINISFDADIKIHTQPELENLLHQTEEFLEFH